MTQSRSRTVVSTLMRIAGDVPLLVSAALRSHAQLAAENLFLRKQLAFYVERQAKPRRVDDATRIALGALSRLIEWRQLLIIVKPDTLIRWHRKGFQRLPPHLRAVAVAGATRRGTSRSPRSCVA